MSFRISYGRCQRLGREQPDVSACGSRRVAWAPRQWTQVTDDTGVGNPAAATAARCVVFQSRDGADRRVPQELAGADPNALYDEVPLMRPALAVLVPNDCVSAAAQSQAAAILPR